LQQATSYSRERRRQKVSVSRASLKREGRMLLCAANLMLDLTTSPSWQNSRYIFTWPWQSWFVPHGRRRGC